jgi:hypothetical protein
MLITNPKHREGVAFHFLIIQYIWIQRKNFYLTISFKSKLPHG